MRYIVITNSGYRYSGFVGQYETLDSAKSRVLRLLKKHNTICEILHVQNDRITDITVWTRPKYATAEYPECNEWAWVTKSIKATNND